MKLMLKENAITDMRDIGITNIPKAKEKLMYWPYYLNFQDCTLRPIERPVTYARAKKNPYPIIGVANMSLYQGWNKPRLEGPAVNGIFGLGQFDNVDGENKITSNFAKCEKFYELVPNDPEAYKNAQNIRNDRNLSRGGRITWGKLNDKGEFENRYTGNNRAFTSSDIENYEPSFNKRKYTKLLSQAHLDKYNKKYNDMCDGIKMLQSEISNVDASNLKNYYVRSDYRSLLNKFGDVIDALGDVNHNIEYIARGEYPNIYNDTSIAKDFDKFDKKYNDALTVLTRLQEKELELDNEGGV